MAFDRGRRILLRAICGLPFIGGAAAAIASGAEPGARVPSSPVAPAAPSRPRVARARRDGLRDDKGRLHLPTLDDALGRALARAAGEPTPVAALRRLFGPADVVGVKLNCLAGRGLSPHPLLARRLCDWLQQAGVPSRNIVLWDRSDRELRGAGYTINRTGEGVRCLGTENDYDWTPREWGPGGSCFAKILVRDLTALINVGVLKDHDLAGVSAGLKNWYGTIHNPNKHHDDGCAPYIPHLAATPLIRDKLRLTVIDATQAQCHGGPARNPKWVWPYQGILASTDPVAIDAIGWRIIEERRREVGLPTLAAEKREPVWIAAAAALGLGEADPKRIEVVDA